MLADLLEFAQSDPTMVSAVMPLATLWGWTALSVLARVLGLLLLSPLFGTRVVPLSLRITLGLCLTLIITPTLIAAGAPLDHINNLGWTALMEAVILGDGGRNHQQVVRLLLEAGADRSIADRNGVSTLAHARARSYSTIAVLLEQTR